MEVLSSYLNALDLLNQDEVGHQSSQFYLNIANEFRCLVDGPLLMLDVYMAYARFKGFKSVTTFKLYHPDTGAWLAYDRTVMDYDLDGTEVIQVK
jgi:hypothetical protein